MRLNLFCCICCTRFILIGTYWRSFAIGTSTQTCCWFMVLRVATMMCMRATRWWWSICNTVQYFLTIFTRIWRNSGVLVILYVIIVFFVLLSILVLIDLYVLRLNWLIRVRFSSREGLVSIFFFKSNERMKFKYKMKNVKHYEVVRIIKIDNN